MGLFDRHALPTALRSALAEAVGVGPRALPRVLAWAPTPVGAVLALDDRLAILSGAAWTFTPWHRVLSAGWDDSGSTFMWRSVDRPHALNTVAVTRPLRLPEAVRERVEQSIVARQNVVLGPGARGTLIGRRVLGGEGSGAVEWSIQPVKGVDMQRPEVADAARLLIEAARQDWA